jgi:hypothetical protein
MFSLGSFENFPFLVYPISFSDLPGYRPARHQKKQDRPRPCLIITTVPKGLSIPQLVLPLTFPPNLLEPPLKTFPQGRI